MPKLTIEEALDYLRREQKTLHFSDDFLASPELKSAVLQALLDAGLQPFSEQAEFDYGLGLSRQTYAIPNEQLPFASHLQGAQKLVFSRALRLNG